MSLSAGTRLGSYDILTLLGAGGMGEVYRARDTKLRRDVALKILPPAFAADPDRRTRFTREAQVLASLNHPNIAAIHGIEESDTCTALVLELVEGPTLEERIASGPVPVADTVRFAAQLVDALEAAHDRGIIHRDLKPANIKLTPDDRVKVLDFGLAKALGEDSAAEALNSPTLTGVASRLGVIVGTAAYMSPEQAKGRVVDKRADIWAFGCVVYEMVTGHRAFGPSTLRQAQGRPEQGRGTKASGSPRASSKDEGESITDYLVAIVTKEPDWTLLPAGTPARLVRLLKHCLKKDARERLRDIGDARFELASDSDDPIAPVTAPAAHAATARTRWFVAGAAVAAAAIGAAWLTARTGGGATAPPPLARFAIAIPDGQEVLGLDMSNDGQQLVYLTGPNKLQLYHRALDRLEARAIPATEGADAPFFSPDGQWVGFFADGKLKKVALRGGAPVTLADVRGQAVGVTWATWSANTIVISSDPAGGLTRVSADGGTLEALTTPARERDEIGHLWPHALPGGQGIVFTVLSRQGFHLAALSLATGQWHRLGPSGKLPRYVSTGHLLFADADALLALPFDPDRLAATGTAVPLVDGVGNRVTFGQPTVFFAAAANGTLAYVPNALSRGRLVSVDRSGSVTMLKDEGAYEYTYPRVSPDGRKLVAGSDNAQLWIYDLERGTRSRLTNDGLNYNAVWSPDGSRIAYAMYVARSVDIVWRPADLSAPAAPLVTRETRKYPIGWASDDRFLFQEVSPATGGDLRVIDLKTQAITDIAATPAEERGARLSPDGRWVSYISNETGRFEVFVRPFGRPGGAITVSTNGGSDPVWSSKGDELFYFDGKSIVAARVTTATAFAVASLGKLFEGPYQFGRIVGANYDVTPDGRQFILSTVPQVRAMQITLVLNWAEELERTAPAAAR